MKSRLAAIVLVVAALVGVVQFLRTAAGAALVARMGRWYDDRHGLGEPCTDRELASRSGAYGVEFSVPRCFTVTREDARGTPTDTVLDPGLRRSFSIGYVRKEDEKLWDEATATIERRARSPYSEVTYAGDWRIVRSAFQQPSASAPNRSYEWAVSNGRVAAFVVFEIHKFYVDSPRVVDFVERIAGVVSSFRSDESAAHAPEPQLSPAPSESEKESR